MAMSEDLGPVPPQRSRVSVVFGPAETLISLSGDIDFSALEDLELAAHHAIVRGEPVTIDVSSVTFIDSAGLDQIAEVAAAEAEDGRRPIVVGAQPRLLDLLRASGVAELVVLKPDHQS